MTSGTAGPELAREVDFDEANLVQPGRRAEVGRDLDIPARMHG